jgi:hypothetical protein
MINEEAPLRGKVETEKKYFLLEALKEKPVMLLAEKDEYTLEELEKIRKEKGLDKIYACDFLVKNIEAHEKDGGEYFEWDNILNLDHHSDATSLMGKKMTSTTMGINYLRKNPRLVVQSGSVFTHHSDCDSISSTLIMNGTILPELHDIFAEASVAADYTGKPNPIADLMQALKHGPTGVAGKNASAEFNKEKYEFVVRNLELFLSGKEIEIEAQRLLERHLAQREELKAMKERNEYKSVGPNEEIVYIETDPNAKYDATMLVDIHSKAKIIFTYLKNITTDGEGGEKKEGYIINARAGQNVPAGFDIRKIMENVGEQFGGRWGGGSNKRKTNGVGTTTTPDELAEKLYGQIK